MNEKYLEGNELLVQAFRTANAEESIEHFHAVVDALQTRMLADGHLLLPVVHPEGNEEQFILRTLKSDKGEQYAVAFTDEDEVQKGAPTGILSCFIDMALETVLGMEGVTGMVIDPWSADGSFVLTRTAIQMVLEAKRA
ncbi:MAG: SseB family protein [Butyricicoccus sp.]|nr:SseB family protein [Butyricicoccus sp.]